MVTVRYSFRKGIPLLLPQPDSHEHTSGLGRIVSAAMLAMGIAFVTGLVINQYAVVIGSLALMGIVVVTYSIYVFLHNRGF